MPTAGLGRLGLKPEIVGFNHNRSYWLAQVPGNSPGNSANDLWKILGSFVDLLGDDRDGHYLCVGEMTGPQPFWPCILWTSYKFTISRHDMGLTVTHLSGYWTTMWSDCISTVLLKDEAVSVPILQTILLKVSVVNWLEPIEWRESILGSKSCLVNLVMGLDKERLLTSFIPGKR
jgi:hypothetical protein